jgi:hypothetical protein
MDFKPRRTQGTLIGAGFLLILLGAAGGGLSQLGVSPVTPWIILWVLLPLVSLPLMVFVAYRLYGLWTAVYRMDRDGFALRWGLAREQIPLGQVKAVQRLADLDLLPRVTGRLPWPGCAAGWAEDGGSPPIEVFAGSGLAEGVLIVTENQRLAIAPSNPDQFVMNFTEATRLGSLQPIPAHSARPSFVLTDVWGDASARALILAGALIPLLLLAFVGWQAAGLTGTVPFGFDAVGNPGPPAPPGRLLLLPFMAGVLWLIDLGLGTWLYRGEADRHIAYTLWATSLAGGLLLWGAAIHLLSYV